MRRDAKIGIAIGAVLVVVAGWYFLRRSEPVQELASQQLPAPAEQPGPVGPIEPAGLTVPPAPSQPPAAARPGLPTEPPPAPPVVPPQPPASLPAPPTDQPQPPAPVAPAISFEPPPARPAPPPAQQHVIQPGDTLAGLAERYYGSQADHYIQRLLAANPGVQPRQLRVGSTIAIPPLPPQPAEQLTTPGKPARLYHVRQGDSFYAIADRLIGQPHRWQELYNLNKDLVGGDPRNLRPGQRLRIPPDWPADRRQLGPAGQ